MLPDFNRLKVFYYIFRDRSVVKAARQLHVTQSAISQSLNKLEEELQQSLFTRVHKRLVPTREGAALFSVIQPFVANLKEQVDFLRYSQAEPSGLLKIGAPVEFGEKYLVQACAGFRKKFPQLRFHLDLGHPDKILPRINQGELDFGLADIFKRKGAYSMENASFDIQPIFIEELVLACSRKYYDEVIQGKHHFKILTTCSFISYQPHSPAIRDWFQHHFKKSCTSVKTALTVESVKGVISGIRQNLGLGIVPSHLIQDEIESRKIVVVSTSSRELVNQISLVRLLDKVPNLTEKKFTSYFQEFIKNLKN